MPPRKLISTWIGITLVASIVAALDGGWLASWAALAPARIWRGEIWRLVTWAVVERGAWSLVVTCLVIYQLGGELAVRWGDRRLRRFVVTVVVLAGVATTILGIFDRHVYRCGGWAVMDALVIAWARQFPDGTMLVAGLVPMRGRELVRITIGIAILGAIFTGPVVMAPELVACLVAARYPRG